MNNDSISILLTVYNKETIIKDIFWAMIQNTSDKVKEIIIVLDGCTDESENILKKFIAEKLTVNIEGVIKFIYTDNINETRANNVGLKSSICDYTIIVQDDCLIMEQDFDLNMLKPFKMIPNLLAVSGRDAVDTRFVNGVFNFYNISGADSNTPNNILSIRDVINRSPLMLDNKKLKQLNYLDESFAPLSMDDVDLSIRAYKEFGYLVGSRTVNFISRPEWGTTRGNPESAAIFDQSLIKNTMLLKERHYDFIAGEKHSRDVEIT